MEVEINLGVRSVKRKVNLKQELIVVLNVNITCIKDVQIYL